MWCLSSFFLVKNERTLIDVEKRRIAKMFTFVHENIICQNTT